MSLFGELGSSAFLGQYLQEELNDILDQNSRSGIT